MKKLPFSRYTFRVATRNRDRTIHDENSDCYWYCKHRISLGFHEGISVYGVLVYDVGFSVYSVPVAVCAVVVVPVVSAFEKILAKGVVSRVFFYDF